MMSSRHLGQYKVNFYIMDEVLVANLPPTKAPVTRMVFKSFRFHIVAFSDRSTLGSTLVDVFKCLRFHNRLHRFRVNRR